MIVQEIRSQIKEAMLAGDSDKVALLRLIIGTLQQEGDDSDDAAEKVIRKMIKSNLQTAEALVANGNTASEIYKENSLLNSFLPQTMSVPEIKVLLNQSDINFQIMNPGKAMGAAMKLCKANQWPAQGKDVKQAIDEIQNP